MELKFQIAINAALGELVGSCQSGAPVSLQEQPLFGGRDIWQHCNMECCRAQAKAWGWPYSCGEVQVVFLLALDLSSVWPKG